MDAPLSALELRRAAIHDKVLAVALRIDAFQTTVEHRRKLRRHDDVTRVERRAALLRLRGGGHFARDFRFDALLVSQEAFDAIVVLDLDAALANLIMRNESSAVQQIVLLEREVQLHFRFRLRRRFAAVRVCVTTANVRTAFQYA